MTTQTRSLLRACEASIRRSSPFAGLVILLIGFAVLAYGPRLGLAFIGDDYVFLDKTRSASFVTLWSPSTNIDFGWYRPWSRELYFWTLQHLVGTRAILFRVANVALWIAMLCLYATIIAELASVRVAAIATIGAATLAFWGTPILWVSGSQDLWMLVWMFLSFLLVLHEQHVSALVCFALSLLSKETACIFPGLLFVYFIVLRRYALLRATKAAASFVVLEVVWVVLHPTLRTRFLGKLSNSAEVQDRLRWWDILWRSPAAALNIDRLPHPQEVTASVVVRIAATAVLLGGALWIMLRARRQDHANPARDLRLMAAGWVATGWAPLFLPSIGWHAYYGCIGALGVWYCVGLWLADRPRVAISLVVALAVLRGAQANTLSSDWGDESYFCRAGSTLQAIQQELRRQHPVFPHNARVYFTTIPYHIGLIAGRSPAIRVWYSDSTLSAGYYSYYRPRRDFEPPGNDYFFRFDSSAGMVEISVGPEDTPRAMAMNPQWEADHEDLAILFMEKNDLRRAAGELVKLSMLSGRPGAAVYAAECLALVGEKRRSDSLLLAIRSRTHGTDVQLRDFARRCRLEIIARERSSP